MILPQPGQETVLFVGGARCGKSALAQRWAEARAPQRLFLATCLVEDEEMAARVARHQAGRTQGWHCREEALDPLHCLTALTCPGGLHSPGISGGHGQGGVGAAGPVGVVLLDCVSLWLANLLASGLSAAQVEGKVAALAAWLQKPPLPVALVSLETGLGIVPGSAVARQYRDALGLANQALAAVCARVIFVSCGLPLVLKGRLPEELC